MEHAPAAVARRAVVLALAAVGLVLTTMSPGIAHSVVNPMKTLQSQVVSAPSGVRVTVAPNGSMITVSSSVPLIILGYDREPFLRFSGGHVAENTNSLTTYDAQPGMLTSIPDTAGHGPPVWRRLGGASYGWSDHRIVWGGAILPEAVSAAPKKRHLMDTWTIPVQVGGRAAQIRGRVVWVPAGHSVMATVAAWAGVLIVVLGLGAWAALHRPRAARTRA